ncbi:type VI secretion system needle protein Hcp [Capnocytophaga cynodegmi]|uniref:Type VI secretion system needle protein Hcp n=1 Tax=Capnocytophaga cynodegmi TaxID=28189 RepID=A0A286NTT6_9FLAO|nr:type VI secretion system tube protein TssD [Capnocytophaga cynodegmi]ATA67513.1 type VI secretion system needle protein Hcp [Capnocytophaga cynodegmi]
MNFSDITNYAMKMIQPDANLKVVLIFQGKEYELEQFNLQLSQDVDYKGEPQSEVFGGTIVLKLLQFPDNILSYWATNQFLKKEGEIVFRNGSSSSPLKVKFSNAYCLEMHQNINQGVETILVISAESLLINGQPYHNNWTK